MRREWVSAVLVAMGLGTAIVADAQTKGPPIQQWLSPPLVGPDLFRTYCATCHGRQGKGDGPVARTLKTPPADLTRIAARYGGTFPRERIERFIATGDPSIPAHGTTDMPIWGPIFAGLAPSPEKLVNVRIENLVAHLESIQEK